MSTLDEVRLAPPDMRDEERKREAEFLKKASSDDLQKMFDQVSGCFGPYLTTGLTENFGAGQGTKAEGRLEDDR